MWHRIIASLGKRWWRLRHPSTPPWLVPGTVSLWLYTPDENPVYSSKERRPFFPIIVLAWAWSAGKVCGITVDTCQHWVHSDDDGSYAGNHFMDLLGEIDSDERFAQHIESGHLRFLAAIPLDAVSAEVARRWHLLPQKAGSPNQETMLRAV